MFIFPCSYTDQFREDINRQRGKKGNNFKTSFQGRIKEIFRELQKENSGNKIALWEVTTHASNRRNVFKMFSSSLWPYETETKWNYNNKQLRRDTWILLAIIF